MCGETSFLTVVNRIAMGRYKRTSSPNNVATRNHKGVNDFPNFKSIQQM